MSMKEAGKMQDRIAAERWIRQTHDDCSESCQAKAIESVAIGMTALGLIDEMEQQLTGGHNAGRSITHVLASAVLVEMKRLRGVEQRAKAMLAKREDAAALAVRRGAKPRAQDGVNFMLRSILGCETPKP